MKKIIRNVRASVVNLEKKPEPTVKAWKDVKEAEKDNILMELAKKFGLWAEK